MQKLLIIHIAFAFLLASCHSQKTIDDFDQMKPDLEEASSKYCECMMKADTLGSVHAEDCKQILNDLLLSKCDSNDLAREFVQAAIKECVETRSKVNEDKEE